MQPLVAQPVPEPPAYPRLFNDENAFAYYHADWRTTEDKLIAHNRRTGKQIVVLTIASSDGYDSRSLATAIFRRWGIGDQQTNNGILFLIVRKEQTLTIETGYGIEGEVTDLAAAGLLQSVRPEFEQLQFQLPPQRADKGYIPAINRVIDSLVHWTSQPDQQALANAAAKKKQAGQQRWIRILLILVAILGGWVLLRRTWWWINTKLSEPAVPAPVGKKRKRRSERTVTGQYIIPLLLMAAMIALQLLWHLHWIWTAALLLFLLLRWIYYLPAPKLDAATNKAIQEANRKTALLKKEYAALKQQLGSEKKYASFDAYWEQYLALGLDKIEKQLQTGHYAPRAKTATGKTGWGSLLYDLLIGSPAAERELRNTVASGYSGESTGGQAADGFGGGSSGGGGANG